MSTYDHKQVLSDYAQSKIDVAMAMGHSLQHIAKLYEAQEFANARRQEMRDQITALEQQVKRLLADLNHLQREPAKPALSEAEWVDRLQTVEHTLTALNLTVYHLKDEVDDLKTRLPSE